jgi:hypothetical protein
VELQEQVIPEPGTITLLATGVVLTAYRRRRMREEATVVERD